MPGGIAQAGTACLCAGGEPDNGKAMNDAAPADLPILSDDKRILFRAEGLQKRFGGVRAVQDISFQIQDGIVFAIIGPNGAGKSTLLNLMCGHYQPDAGTMSFDGIDLIGMPAERRVRHGLARTFQKIRLFRQLSVLENVLAGFHIRHRIPAWEYVIHAGVFRKDRERCLDEASDLLTFRGTQTSRSGGGRIAVIWRTTNARARPCTSHKSASLDGRRAGGRSERLGG